MVASPERRAGGNVGVLALQGDYAAHIAALREAGADAFEIRTRAELDRAKVAGRDGT